MIPNRLAALVAGLALVVGAVGCGVSTPASQGNSQVVSVAETGLSEDAASEDAASEDVAPIELKAPTTMSPDFLAMTETTVPAENLTVQAFGPRPQWLEELCLYSGQGIEGLAPSVPEHLTEAYDDLVERMPGADEDAADLDFLEFSDPSHPGSELLRLFATDCAEGIADYYVVADRPPLPELPQDVLETEVRNLLATPLNKMFNRVRRQGPGLGAWLPLGVADLQNSTFLGHIDGNEFAAEGAQTFTKVDGTWQSSGEDFMAAMSWFTTKDSERDSELLETAAVSFVGNEYRLGVPTRHVKVEVAESYVVHVWIDELGQPRRYEATLPLFDTFLWTATNYLEFDPEDVVELPADLRTGSPESGELGEYYGYLNHSETGESEFDYSDRGNGLWAASAHEFHIGGVTIWLSPGSDRPAGDYELVEPLGDVGFEVSVRAPDGEPCEIHAAGDGSFEMNAVGQLTVHELEVRDHGAHSDELFRASLEFTFTCNVGKPNEWTVSGIYKWNATK